MSDSARILIAVAPYYKHITDPMIEGARRALDKEGWEHELVEVAGAFELPFAVATAYEAGGYDGYIVLGCVIRGETSHYDLICNETARACQNLATDGGLVLGFGLLTVENEAQALVRADPNGKDKGGEAAKACIMNLKLARRFLES
ncbi:MAG: 6,7-dimethyl-8-ribityllumazine synthase [Alphaproteobacteria bacterium]|nr:6,7-dimethyl-8-ribityllumazine synthase [Alphaproteobacteria bacterium]MCB9931044.1 6,7-dimethyl-8-ribityllumazine synthase [Alphaproteobacteria bacterium]